MRGEAESPSGQGVIRPTTLATWKLHHRTLALYTDLTIKPETRLLSRNASVDSLEFDYEVCKALAEENGGPDGAWRRYDSVVSRAVLANSSLGFVDFLTAGV